MPYTTDHIITGPDATMPAGSNGYPMWASDTLTFYIWQDGTRRAQASQAWVSGLYAPLASPVFTGTLTIPAIAVPNDTAETPARTRSNAVGHNPGDYNVGWRFIPKVTGYATHLAFMSNDTSSHTVWLFNSAGTVLASVTVTGVGGNVWQVSAITPVQLVAGNTYTVSYRSGAGLNYSYDLDAFPSDQGSLTMLTGVYAAATNAMPTTTDTAVFYLADITFVPNAGLPIAGDILPATDDAYYIGESGKAYKGLVLNDTTNGNPYRITVVSGTLTATAI